MSEAIFTFAGPVTLKAKDGNVCISRWSDGSISLEVQQGITTHGDWFQVKYSRRYWLQPNGKGRLVTDAQIRAAKARKTKKLFKKVVRGKG